MWEDEKVGERKEEKGKEQERSLKTDGGSQAASAQSSAPCRVVEVQRAEVCAMRKRSGEWVATSLWTETRVDRTKVSGAQWYSSIDAVTFVSAADRQH